jgi:hypothetical protein
MNKFSTLFASLCSLLIASSALAQPATTVDQHFESQTEVDELTFNCWTFNNFGYSSTSPLASSLGSLQSTATTSSTIETPLLNIPTDNLSISFKYKVLSTPNGNNTLKITLVSSTGQLTNIESFKINTSATEIGYVHTFSAANTQGKNISGSRKVVIEIVNAVVQVDDLTINAEYTNPGGCAPAPITLPVKLINFQGSINNNKGQLKWAVADNETGDHFQVMRSTDGKNFSEAGTVFINGKVGAESYSFSDALELAATTFYQLKIVNKNGSIAYSNIITLKSAPAKQAASLTILQNPVAATLNFSYAATSAGQTNLSIYTTSGVKVYNSRISSLKGTNAVSLPLDRHMAPGTYILEVSNGTERNVAKMVKQ